MSNIKTSMLIAPLVVCSTTVKAQNNKIDNALHTPRWSSDKGYWVIKSNIKPPDTSLVTFYTNSDQLVYTENNYGQVISPSGHYFVATNKGRLTLSRHTPTTAKWQRFYKDH